MTTPKERLGNNVVAEKLARMCAGENQDALDYLYMISSITRVIDDIYDQDQVVNRDTLLSILEMLFIKLPINPFYISNQDALVSQHISMWNAWMAANAWEDGDKTEQIYAHVWRDTLHELCPIVALLTQDYEAMKHVSNEMRYLYKKDLGD